MLYISITLTYHTDVSEVDECKWLTALLDTCLTIYTF